MKLKNNEFGIIDSLAIKRGITMRYKIGFGELHHQCTNNPKELDFKKVMTYKGRNYMLKVLPFSTVVNGQPFLVEVK